jgi:AMP nucleosidase
VSDLPMTPEGVKTEQSDREVTREWADLHLELGIEALSGLGQEGETIKHFTY